MKLGTFRKTPDYVWRHIFQYATAWDPIPTESDSNLQKVAFFTPGCERYHQYVDAENTRRNIRLVCRVWNGAVGRMWNNLAYNNNNWEFWPSAKAAMKANCFEFLNIDNSNPRMNGHCTRHRIPIKIRAHCLPSSSPNGSWSSSDTGAGIFRKFWRSFGFRRTRILLIEGSEIELDKIFEQAPNLRAISCTLWDSVDAVVDMGKLRHDHLTHLRITNVSTEQLSEIRNQFQFPSLKHLEFDLNGTLDTDEDYSNPLSTWNLSNLTTLLVRGFAKKEVRDDLEVMVARCSRKLEIVVICIHVEEEEDGTENREFGSRPLWTALSHITLLGVSLDWFRAKGTISTHYNAMMQNRIPLTIYIHDFKIRNFEDEPAAVLCARNLIRWCMSLPRVVTRIAIQVSWLTLSRAEKVYNRETWIQSLACFFDIILRSRIPFCDKDGLTLGDEGTQYFIEGMKRQYFDLVVLEVEDPDPLDSDLFSTERSRSRSSSDSE